MQPPNVNKRDNEVRVTLFLNASPAAMQIFTRLLGVLLTVATLYLPNSQNLKSLEFSNPPVAIYGESKK
jgi:hypothetical protein